MVTLQNPQQQDYKFHFVSQGNGAGQAYFINNQEPSASKKSDTQLQLPLLNLSNYRLVTASTANTTTTTSAYGQIVPKTGTIVHNQSRVIANPPLVTPPNTPNPSMTRNSPLVVNSKQQEILTPSNRQPIMGTPSWSAHQQQQSQAHYFATPPASSVKPLQQQHQLWSPASSPLISSSSPNSNNNSNQNLVNLASQSLVNQDPIISPNLVSRNAHQQQPSITGNGMHSIIGQLPNGQVVFQLPPGFNQNQQHKITIEQMVTRSNSPQLSVSSFPIRNPKGLLILCI